MKSCRDIYIDESARTSIIPKANISKMLGIFLSLNSAYVNNYPNDFTPALSIILNHFNVPVKNPLTTVYSKRFSIYFF